MSGPEDYIAGIEDGLEQARERVKKAAEYYGPYDGIHRVNGTPADQEPPPQVKLIRGDSIKPEAIDWLWLHYLARGKLHVLAGAPGTGKSTIAFSLAAAITSGGKWPDGTRAPRGNTLIWSGEDDPADTIMPRMLAAGADPRRIYIVSGTEHKGESRPFDPAKDMDSLRAAALSLGDVHLLIADPIVSAVAGDSHKNTEVRRALQPLVDLGAALGCAVLGISHFSKGTAGRDPTERVTGSIAFAALARIVLATAKAEGDGPRILARAKSNIGPDSDGFEYSIGLTDVPGYPGIVASRIEWGAPVTGSARELLGTAEEAPDEGGDDSDAKGTTDEAGEWLREVLEGGRVPAKEIQKLGRDNAFAWRTLQRAKDRIGAKSDRDGFGRGATVYWTLGIDANIGASLAEQDCLAPMDEVGAYGENSMDANIGANTGDGLGAYGDGADENTIGAKNHIGANGFELEKSGANGGAYGDSTDEVLL